MKLKSIGLKLLTTALTALLAFQAPLQSLRVAAASTSYISEIIISYGNTDEEAKNWLTKNGYKIVNQNLNEGGEGGSSAMSWLGLASKKRSVYLGYKTTTDAAEAITDMKIMNMNGGYSYQAYEQVLENTRKEKEHFLNNIMAALAEYRENYAAGKTKAKIAHDNLNKFRDDDSGQLMGDLLLNTLKTEDEAAWEADPTQHADMVTILMQGNSTCVSEIMQNLAFAAGTEEESWLNRAIDKVRMQNLDFIAFDEEDAAAEEKLTDSETEIEVPEEIEWKNGLELLIDDYQERFPTYDKDTLITLMIAEYDDHAKMMASSLIGLHNFLTNYTKSELSAEATLEEADAYFAEHPFEDRNAWASAYTLYDVLSNTWYDNEPLLNYLVYNDYDYLSNTDFLEGYEEVGLPQRALLYPFIDEMSQGERSLLEYTAMNRMITFGLMDEDAWSSTDATMQDPEFGAVDMEECSVYADVNRDDFKVGSIAVTNMAQGKEATTGETMSNGVGSGVSVLSVGLTVGGVAVTVAGTILAIKNWNTGTSAVNGQALQNIVNESGNIVNEMPAVIDVGTDVVKRIEDVNKVAKHYLESVGIGTASMVYDYLAGPEVPLNAFNIKIDQILTSPGADNIKFKPVFNNDNMTITLCDGTQYDFSGSELKTQYVEEFDVLKSMKNVQNPDLVKAAGNNITKKAYENAVSTMQSDMCKFIEKQQTSVFFLHTNLPRNEEFIEKLSDIGTDINHLSVKKFSDLTDDEIDLLLEYSNESTDKNLSKYMTAYLESKKTVKQYEAAHAADKLDDMVEKGDDLAENADDAMTAATGSPFWKWFGVGMAIIGLAMSAYGVYSMISEMKAYYHVEMLPIPRKMVDIGYQDDGSSCYLYYDCTKCNRSEQGMSNDTLEDYGDLNGDVMKQWLALYTTKDRRAGSPITESLVVKKGTTTMPLKTKPLSFFGFESAVNMTDKNYTYNDKKNGIYLYYKVDNNASYTGTVTTNGMFATVGVLSGLGGAGICAALMTVFGKRKKETAAETA